MARKLTVVTAGTPAPPPKVEPPKSIKEAVDRSERDLLVALRRRIAAEMDSGPPAHTLAPMARQLRELDREIRALDAREAQESPAERVDDGDFDASAV